MGVFVRAVITGFGLSVGKAIYDKVSERFLGEGNEDSGDDPPTPIIDDDSEAIGTPS